MIGENFLILYISLNADPARKEEAGLIEDENQEHQNVKRAGKQLREVASNDRSVKKNV